MPVSRSNHSGDLDVFGATHNFDGGLDGVATDSPVGQPKIRSIRPRSTTLEQLFRDDKRPRLGAKIVSFISSIFHPTKCKPKSSNFYIPKVPKPLKTGPALCPKIPREELRRLDSFKIAINDAWLVHQANLSMKTNRVFDEFVEYTVVLNKRANEVVLSTEGRMGFRKTEGQEAHGSGYCEQRVSVCSSDLFELENYKL